MAQMFDNSALEAVIRLEMIPAVVKDTPGAENFTWAIGTFSYDPVTNSYQATLSAMSLYNAQIFSTPIVVTPLLDEPVEDLFKQLDTILMQKVADIVASVHVEGQLCSNKFCAQCYA